MTGLKNHDPFPAIGNLEKGTMIVSTKTKDSNSSTPTALHADWITLTAFGLMVVLIGANFVAVRFSNLGLPPFWGAGIRFGAASLIFLVYVAIRRHPLPRGRALAGAVLFGFLQYGFFYALAYYALIEVPAGLMSVAAASAPIFTLLFAAAARLERLTWQGMLGAAVAFGGIASIFSEWAGIQIQINYMLAGVGAVIVVSMAGVVFKLLPPVNPHAMNGVAMLTGALFLLSLSFATGEEAVLPVGFNTWIALLYLVLFGSVAVFALFLFVLSRWTASGVSYQAVLSPVVTILLSVWLLAEPISNRLILGSALVLAGIYLGSLSPAAKPGTRSGSDERPARIMKEAPCDPCP